MKVKDLIIMLLDKNMDSEVVIYITNTNRHDVDVDRIANWTTPLNDVVLIPSKKLLIEE